MRKKTMSLLSILLIVVMGACSANDESSDEKESSEDITLTFGVTDWTSTTPPTKIAGIILEEMGYNVDENKSDPGAVYAGMSRGDNDIFMDSWFPAQKQYVDKYSDSIENISVSYDEANSGMVVPKYMEDINDVGDLKGKEDIFDNEMLAIGEGDPAMESMKEVIAAYDVDIDMIHSSEGAMLAAALPKMEKEEPVLLYGWRPHTMFNKYDLKILTNEDAPEGLFEGSSVNIIVNKELKEKAPDAYEFLSNWSISIEEMEKMIARIDDGEDSEDVAQEWIDNHQDEIAEMKKNK